ncbi:ODV-EC43 [Parapoynx stagnalis nucleopolyhedrovirus]|uniref:ODV-EC43 n=1 Tax=Parapoynx stagnalis nucleopolyhedrovirus TaxID=2993413 RepID=A0A9E7YF51_9ABAC|nr:ODV-EC43 [Parapoynx stagnalis nucleopolyhedrovirus]
MECPFDIKVYISDRYFLFPYDMVQNQNDVGNKTTNNLIVYVPLDSDRFYIDQNKFTRFDSVLILRHEHDKSLSSKTPKKTPNATIVYWNPIVPITEIGAGQTRVFSVLLTNNLFYCNIMIVHHENPTCPIEFQYPSLEMQQTCKTLSKEKKVPKLDYKTLKKLKPIASEVSLSHFNELKNENDFLLCFQLETSVMVKILSLKRIFCIFQYRKEPARYVINLPHEEIDFLYNKLKWERARRLTRGDIPSTCSTVNRASLMYIKQSQSLLGIADYSQTIVDFVKTFQKLIFPYQMVPNVLIKLNNLDRNYQKIRLFCKNDSIAITSFGIAPINLPDINPVETFDGTDYSTVSAINQTMQKICTESSLGSGVTVTPMQYNYYL